MVSDRTQGGLMLLSWCNPRTVFIGGCGALRPLGRSEVPEDALVGTRISERFNGRAG